MNLSGLKVWASGYTSSSRVIALVRQDDEKEQERGSMDILTRHLGLWCRREYRTPYIGHRSSIDEAQLHNWVSE